jgi:NADH-quinone oxidoreductase subunit K
MGQVFCFFTLAIAAAESAIGLAILVVYYRGKETTELDDQPLMKG